MAAEVLEPEAPEVDYSRIKRWVIKRDGKDYVQYAGLLDLLHQESQGDFAITTRLEQAPTEANGGLAIVSATVTMGKRIGAGLGDASAESVNRMMAPHLVRMAETRAKGRALRDLLNIGLVTVDELGPGAEAPRPGGGAAPRPVAPRPASFDGPAKPWPVSPAAGAEDAITVEGVEYTREQVWVGWQQRQQKLQALDLVVPDKDAQLARTAPLALLVAATRDGRRRCEAVAASRVGAAGK